MEYYNLPKTIDDFGNFKKSKFGVFEAALACLLFIIFNLVFSFVLAIFDINPVTGTFLYFVLSFIVEGLFAIVAILIATTRKIKIVEAAGLDKKINMKMVLLCFLTSIISIVLLGDVTSVFLNILTLLGYNSIMPNIEIETFSKYLGYIITTCFVAAFCEEILFRGVILSGLKKYGIKIAVIISALIFTLMHGNAEQTVHQFIIGALIGYIFYVTGNFWIGFFIHMFNNFIPISEVYLLSFISTESAETATESVVEASPAIGTIIFTIIIQIIFAGLCAWAGIFFIKMIFRRLVKENENLNGKKENIESSSTVKVEGVDTEVQMTIDGKVVTENLGSTEDEFEKQKPLGTITKVMFILSGAFLIINWIVHLLYGFMI